MLTTYPTSEQAMKALAIALSLTKGDNEWVMHWAVWDDVTHEYVGYGPDEEELLRHSGPATFIDKFQEAATQWAERNK